MFNIKSVLVAFIATFIAIGCSNDDNKSAVSPNNEVRSSSRLTSDEVDFDEVAQALAAALTDTELRKFIKLESGKKFDGDYDVLLSKVIDTKVGDKSVENHLNEGARKKGKQIDLKKILVRNELINISVPVNIEDWDVTTYVPLVAVAPESDKVAQIKAYSSDGGVVFLDAKKAPNYPVIVINVNERVAMKNGKAEVKKGLIDAPSSNGKKMGTHSGARMASICRQEGDYLKISSVRMDIDAIESWYRGKPDVVMHVRKAVNDVTSGQFYFSPERNKDDQWVDCNVFLFNWYSTIPELVFVWIEEDDRGEDTNYTFEYDKFKLNIPTQVHDIVMHNMPYHFDSCPSGLDGTQELSGGSISWKITSYRY